MKSISNRRYLLTGALVLLAIGSILLILDTPAPEPMQRQILQRSTDYSMTNFTMRIMDETGALSRIVHGAQLNNYRDDGSTDIEQPITEFVKVGYDTWVLRAEHAETPNDGDLIKMTGDVLIINRDQPEIQLLTELLYIDATERTAYTDLPVEIRSPTGVTHSVGLHAILADKTVNLHSEVRGTYDAPPAQP